MRKILSVLAVMLAVVCSSAVLVSCGDDGDDDSPKTLQISQILGTWEDVDKTEKDYISGTIAVEWTFNYDKSGYEYMYFSVNGKKLRENYFNFTFTMGTNFITIKDNTGNTKKYYISFPGANHMKFGNDEDGYFYLKRKN